MSEQYGRLLNRQIKKYLKNTPLTGELEELLAAIQQTYEHYDSDRQLLERAMNLSSQELMDKNDELQHKNELLDSFAYRISHDLKAPTANMQSMLTLLRAQQEEPDEMSASLFERLTHSCDSIQERITNILEYTRVEKAIRSQFDCCELETISKEIFDSIQHLVEEANPIIQADFSACPEVWFPREHLYSILYNLISNAIKYRNPKRKLNLQISSGSQEGWFLIKVADNGLGIDLKKAEGRLFGMFSRFHDHVEGSGMGLYIIKKLLDAHNGSISIESTPGEGSLFTIKISAETHNNHEVRSGIIGR